MGLFQHKQTAKKQKLTDEQAAALEGHFLDENFREELRNHGRLYFENVINENAKFFKDDLNATIIEVKADLKDHVVGRLDASITRINNELKEHIAKQLEEEFSQYGSILKEAQDKALQSFNESANAVQDEHQKLSTTIQQSVANQRIMVDSMFQKNMEEIAEVKKGQEQALASLNQSVEAVQKQYEELTASLKDSVERQENALINAFEDNMAHVVEQYLLGALGDQYDLKAQLPSIIQQMESNKQAIVDDMKL